MKNPPKYPVAGQLAKLQAVNFVINLTFCVLCAVSPHSYAQDQSDTSKKPEQNAARLNTLLVDTDAETESSSAQLDYLTKDVVTGALGNKTVLDTPFSITVIDSNEIVTRGAKSIGQIFVNDASVYAPTPSSSTDWWGTQIRGLPVRNFYADDIPMLLY